MSTKSQSEIVESTASPADNIIPIDSKLRKLARRAKNKVNSVPQGWGQMRSAKVSSETRVARDEIVEELVVDTSGIDSDVDELGESPSKEVSSE